MGLWGKQAYQLGSITDVYVPSGRDSFPTGYGNSSSLFYHGRLMNFGAPTKQALLFSFPASQFNYRSHQRLHTFATLMLSFAAIGSKVYIQMSDS